ncbi:MAG: SpoIVB peptidase [Clostridia bacterium]
MNKFFKKVAVFSVATAYILLYVLGDYKYGFTQASAFNYNDNITDVTSVEIESIEELMLIPLGTSFGIKLYTDGVIVSALQDIVTENGTVCPADEAGIEVGDYIMSLNGEAVESNSHFSSLIYNNLSNEITLEVKRDDEIYTTTVTPVYDGENYMLGLWIKDSAAGIGTLTFAYPNTGVFGGLGHGICDSDSGELVSLKGGQASSIIISNIIKASEAETGSICGYFSNYDDLGTLYENNSTGIFGILEETPEIEPVYVMAKEDVTTGAVTILTTLDNNGVQSFDAEIISIAYDRTSLSKNFVIKITDEDLLKATGGIIQGMSGSPILQDGKIVGAVTHVFVNDSTKGYGIFIENMLETAETIK